MKMTRFEKRFVNSASHSRRVAEAVKERLPIVPYRARMTYLDIGCGNGSSAVNVASAYGFEVTGIDVDPEQIRAAQEAVAGRVDVRFQVGDATHLPFDAAEFDIVATNKTTHHISQWKMALAEMVRVVKPGGWVIYGDLVVPRWLARLGESVAGGLAGFVTRADLDDFVHQHGLTVVQQAARSVSYEAVWRKPTA